MRQYRVTCLVDGMCQPGRGSCFSRLGGEPWGFLFAAEPLGSDTEGPGAEDRYSHSGVGSSSWQGPGELQNHVQPERAPWAIRWPGKGGHIGGEERKAGQTEREGVGAPAWGGGPEKRRCSMKSRWKGESVNRRS